MKDHLLVGVTDSLASRVAVEWTMRRAALTDSTVTLVHVVDDGEDAAPPRATPRSEADVDGRLLLLERETRFARSIARSIVVHGELLHGRVMDALVALSPTADMVIVGTHRTGFIHGTVFGSTSLQLAASAGSPVVIVPSRVEVDPAGVVVGVDDSPVGRVAVRVAASEAHDTGERLTLIRVWDPPRGPGNAAGMEHQRRSTSLLLSSLATAARTAHPGLQVQIRSMQRVPARGLVDASRSATLLVVGDSHPRAGTPLTLGAVCHDVLMNIAAPTMVVHRDLAEHSIVASTTDVARQLNR